MRIGEVTRRTGIPASAIRFYEAQGIIERPQRDVNGYRRYKEAAIEKLQLVRDAQLLGFSLETIRGLFLRDGSCSMSFTVAQIDLRLGELNQIEEALKIQRSKLLGLRDVLKESLSTGTEPLFDKPYKISP